MRQVGHVIALMPTLLEVAGASDPKEFKGRARTAIEGCSLAPLFQGNTPGPRTLADLAADRTETNNLASANPAKVRELGERWQAWADRVGVVPWERLPGSSFKPAKGYRRQSEPVVP